MPHSTTHSLPGEGLKTEKMPGHWVLARLGKRVLRPGGQLLSLDFNRPSNPLLRSAYLLYLTILGSALGYVLHRDPNTYRYIPESIRTYPGAEGVARMVEDHFANPRHP